MNSIQVFWWRMLVAVTVFLMLFGLTLVLMPTLTLHGFSLLFYGSTERIIAFGAEATAYIRLLHAVLGAVMFGWGVVLMYLALGPLRRGVKAAWYAFAITLLAWFIPDTAYSLVSGFWQNAVLNVSFALLFALPLLGLRAYCHPAD